MSAVARRPFPSFNRAHCLLKFSPFCSLLTSNLQTRKRGPKSRQDDEEISVMSFNFHRHSHWQEQLPRCKRKKSLRVPLIPVLSSPQTLSSVNQWSLSSSQFNLSQWWLHVVRCTLISLSQSSCKPHNVLDFFFLVGYLCFIALPLDLIFFLLPTLFPDSVLIFLEVVAITSSSFGFRVDAHRLLLLKGK